MMGKYSQGLGELTPLKFGAQVKKIAYDAYENQPITIKFDF